MPALSKKPAPGRLLFLCSALSLPALFGCGSLAVADGATHASPGQSPHSVPAEALPAFPHSISSLPAQADPAPNPRSPDQYESAHPGIDSKSSINKVWPSVFGDFSTLSSWTKKENGQTADFEFDGSFGIKGAEGAESSVVGHFAARGLDPTEARETISGETFENLETRSWNLALSPIPGMRLFAGSVSARGIAARMANPVPVAPAPFRLPRRAADDALLERSDTLSTGKTGIECHGENLRAAILADSDAPDYALGTASGVWRGDGKKALELGFCAATGSLADGESDSWFPETAPLPARKRETFGIGATADIGPFLADALTMVAVDGFGLVSGYGSLEGALETAWGSVAAGIVSMDRGFTAQNGSVPGTLERVYAAPTISLLPLFGGFDAFRAGVVFSLKTVRREKTWENDEKITEEAGKIEIRRGALAWELDARQTDQMDTPERHAGTALCVPVLPQRAVIAALSARYGDEGRGSPFVYVLGGAIKATPHPVLSIAFGAEFSGKGDPTPVPPDSRRFELGFEARFAPKGSFNLELSREESESTRSVLLKAALRLGFAYETPPE